MTHLTRNLLCNHRNFHLQDHLQFSKTLPIRRNAGRLRGDLDGSSYEIRTKGGQENSVPGMQNVWGVERAEPIRQRNRNKCLGHRSYPRCPLSSSACWSDSQYNIEAIPQSYRPAMKEPTFLKAMVQKVQAR